MADFSDWESETKSEAKSDRFIKISPRLKPKEQSLNILIKRGIIRSIRIRRGTTISNMKVLESHF